MNRSGINEPVGNLENQESDRFILCVFMYFLLIIMSADIVVGFLIQL